MEFRRTWLLRGPNMWSRAAAIEVGVELGESAGPAAAIPGFFDRLAAWLPQRDLSRILDPQANLADVLARLAIELQKLAGEDVDFAVARPTHEPGVFKVAFEYRDEELGRACLETARELCLAAMNSQSFDAAALDRLRALAAGTDSNAATRPILAAARERGIPAQRLTGDLLLLGQGVHQRRIRGAETDDTAAVGGTIAYDRELTRTLLQSIGLPVAYGRTVSDADDAWATAEEIAAPVIVRPQYRGYGKSIGNLNSREEIAAAYAAVRKETSYVLVEQFAVGSAYRLLVAGGQLVAAYREDASTPVDVAAGVHPETAERAVEAARVVGLNIASVGVVAEDVARPLEDQGGIITGVTAAPDLSPFVTTSPDNGRQLAGAIVATAFPAGETGRIPVVAVTGTNGKTTTTRLLAHILQQAGRFVGMACTDGIYLDGRRTETRDCSGPHSARSVLMNPRVEAAVLETARGGILREGLGFEFCDVAVVTNIGEGDHFGLRGIETLDELAEVKRTVVQAVDPAGAAVLKADDPLVAAMAEHCPGAVVYFALDGGHPLVVEHRQRGGRAVLVRNANVILADGAAEQVLMAAAEVAIAHGGRVGFQLENALAAAAAAGQLKVHPETLRAALASFSGDAAQAPGRFNVISAGGTTIIVDYAHNPSAVAALAEAATQFPQPRRTIVFSSTNRRDADLIRQGQILGAAFDRVILYRDFGHADRADGELNALLRRGLAEGPRTRHVEELDSERAAIEAALAALGPDELLVLGVESIEDSLAFIRERLAHRAVRDN